MSFQTLNRPVTYTLLNNQATPVILNNLVIDGTQNGLYIIDYSIIRSTTTPSEVIEKGYFIGRYNPNFSVWNLFQTVIAGNAGITFSQTFSGQLQYTSSNIAGTPVLNSLRVSIKLL